MNCMNEFEYDLLALMLMVVVWLWIFIRYDLNKDTTSFVLFFEGLMIFVHFLMFLKYDTSFWNII